MPIFAPFGYMEQREAAIPPTPLILDTYGNGVVAGYSLRKLKSGYTGPAIQVRRSTDNVLQDISFDASGNLDTSALTTFIGANSGFVQKWYDQSGQSEDMEQTTQANQPLIVDSGTLIQQNSLPAIRFDGTNDAFTSIQSTNPFSYSGAVSIVSAVYKNSTTTKAYETILGAGATGTAGTNNDKMLGLSFGNSGTVSPSPTVSTDIWRPSGIQYDGTISENTRQLVGLYISNWSTHRSTGLSNLTLNGGDVSTKTYSTVNPASPLNTNPMKLGVFDEILTTSFFGGDMQEVLVWGADKNNDRVGIQTDMNDYYDIIIPWNPSFFSNAQYWWRADSGVTTTGTGVSAWADQINGFTMIQNTDANRPTETTSSTLNNAEVISFNGTSDFIYTATTPAAFTGSDLTILSVLNLIDKKTGGVTTGVSYVGNGTRFWMDTLNNSWRVIGENIYSPTASAYTISSGPTYGAKAIKLRYDASAGNGFQANGTLTETSMGTNGDVNTTWQAGGTVAMGALVVSTSNPTVFGGRYVEVEVAEQVFVYGTPSSSEMDEWKDYVNARYGTIIS